MAFAILVTANATATTIIALFEVAESQCRGAGSTFADGARMGPRDLSSWIEARVARVVFLLLPGSRPDGARLARYHDQPVTWIEFVESPTRNCGQRIKGPLPAYPTGGCRDDKVCMNHERIDARPSARSACRDSFVQVHLYHLGIRLSRRICPKLRPYLRGVCAGPEASSVGRRSRRPPVGMVNRR